MGEDLTQSGDDQSPETAEDNRDNYVVEWRKFYEEDKVKFDDAEEEITRRDRYNNLPTAIQNNGNVPTLATLKKSREEARAEGRELPEKFLTNLKKLEEISGFIREQMEKISLTPIKAMRAEEIAKKPKISKKDYDELVAFTGEMEKIIQAGLKEGYTYRDLVA